MLICLGIITCCQVTVYGETRRQEKQIAAQQISAEARQNFPLKIAACVQL